MTNGIVILLVEDEPLVQLNIEDALVDAGFAVLLASSGTEALALIERKDREIAGIISDIRLGDGPNGWEVVRIARECRADIPVIYITGDSAHEWASRGVPGSIMVQKPFVAAQLVVAIANLLNLTDGCAG